MKNDILEAIQEELVTWPGKSIAQTPFIKLLNSEGRSETVFWCFQAPHEFAALAHALGHETALYGLRSGHLVMEYTEENIARVTRLYANEIRKVCLENNLVSITLGGNCQGGGLMLRVAKQFLQESDIALSIVVLESTVPEQLNVPVKLIYGRQSSFNLFRRYHSIDRGLGYFYKNFSMAIIPGAHGQFFTAENVPKLAAEIAGNAPCQFRMADSSSGLNVLPKSIDEAFFYDVAVTEVNLQSESLETLKKAQLDVKLKNIGSRIIPAGQLTLSNQWYSSNDCTLYRWLDGSTDIPRLEPGADLTLSLMVQPPLSPGRYNLRTRFSQEGVSYYETDNLLCVDVKPRAFSACTHTPTKRTKDVRKRLLNEIRKGNIDYLQEAISSASSLTRREWLLILDVFAKEQRWPDVATLCQTLISELRMDKRFLNTFIRALTKLGHNERSIELYEHYQDVHDQNDAKINSLWLEAVLGTGDTEMPFKCLLNQSLPIANRLNLLKLFLSHLYINKLTKSEVLQVVDAVYQRDKSLDAYLKISYALSHHSCYSETHRVLHEAIEKHPRNATLCLRQARTCRNLGQLDQTTRYYQQALQVAPGNIEATQWLNANERV